MRTKITPIQNKQLLESVSTELRNMNEQYYLIFQLILETGMPLEAIPLLKIKDIKESPISFMPSHKYVIRSEYLSQQLLKSLRAFAGTRNDDSPAFHALKDELKPFPVRNFQKALLRVSEILTLDPPITALALRKTYILNVFLKEHNYNKIYALTECRSVKSVLEYLNLEVPKPDNKYLSGYTVKEALIKEKLVSKALKHSTKVLSETEKLIADNPQISYEQCQEILKMTTDIENSLTRYEDLANNPTALKDLYNSKLNL